MDTIVLILILLMAFSFLLKQTFWKPVAVGAAAGVSVLFVLLTWPYAIEQSKTQIADWLSDNRLMLDTSVVLTLEVVLQMAFCLLAVHVANYTPVKRRMKLAYRLLFWFPGVLIIPVLFFGLTQAIFLFPGVSFQGIAWSFALFVAVVIPLGRWLIRWLLPEEELRLELFFLTNALIAILGIIATVNGKTAVEGVSEVNWSALLGCFLIFAVGVVVGWIVYVIKRKLILKRKDNEYNF